MLNNIDQGRALLQWVPFKMDTEVQYPQTQSLAEVSPLNFIAVKEKKKENMAI